MTFHGSWVGPRTFILSRSMCPIMYFHMVAILSPPKKRQQMHLGDRERKIRSVFHKVAADVIFAAGTSSLFIMAPALNLRRAKELQNLNVKYECKTRMELRVRAITEITSKLYRNLYFFLWFFPHFSKHKRRERQKRRIWTGLTGLRGHNRIRRPFTYYEDKTQTNYWIIKFGSGAVCD